MCGLKIQFFGHAKRRVNFWLLFPARLLIEACGKLYPGSSSFQLLKDVLWAILFKEHMAQNEEM